MPVSSLSLGILLIAGVISAVLYARMAKKDTARAFQKLRLPLFLGEVFLGSSAFFLLSLYQYSLQAVSLWACAVCTLLMVTLGIRAVMLGVKYLRAIS